MNKGILVLGIFVLAATSFAFVFPVLNPYMNSKIENAWCQYTVLFSGMNSSIHSFNHSYDGRMAQIRANMSASINNMGIIYCTPPYNNIAAFNSEYNKFSPLTAQTTALFFKSAFEEMMIPDGISWASVFSTYQGYQSDYQSCLAAGYHWGCI